jgi:hypothetical protein
LPLLQCARHPRLIAYPAIPRHFETDHALHSHWKTKIHKKRCKLLREPAYTIEEAERAAGLGRESKRAQHGVAVDAPMPLVADVDVVLVADATALP